MLSQIPIRLNSTVSKTLQQLTILTDYIQHFIKLLGLEVQHCTNARMSNTTGLKH